MTLTKTTTPRKKKTAASETTITAYKGFGQDWTCLGFQYEIGKSYEHKGKVQACATGFHACENPMDVWDYYPITDSKFAIVELSGEFSRDGTDTKIAAGKITLRAELGLPQIISEGIKYVIELCKNAKEGEAASGDYSKQAASGDYSKQAASGDYSKQAASGHSSTQAASGHSSTQAASGDYSKQAASGHSSTQAASGHSSTQAASGDYSKQAASGDYSKQAASGHSSTQAASGDYSKQAASGDYSKQAASGKNAVIVSAGCRGRAKASEGGCFALRWDDDRRPRIAVGYVGDNGIKADTWYRVDSAGTLVECD